MTRTAQILTRILVVSSGLALLACYVGRSQRQQTPAFISVDVSTNAPHTTKQSRAFAPGSKSAPVDVFTRKGQLPIQPKEPQ